jgi:hypothetical protein
LGAVWRGGKSEQREGVDVEEEGGGGPFLLGGVVANGGEDIAESVAGSGFDEHLVAVFAADAGDGGGGGAEDFDAGGGGFEQAAEFGGPGFGLVLAFAANDDVGEDGEGRVAHGLAEAGFFFVELGVVLFCGEADGVVVRVEGLDEDFAGAAATAGAAGGLSE